MDVKSIVDQVDTLLSLPQVCRQMGRLLENEQCECVELAELIGYDPGLTARIFRLANDPEFNAAPAESISEAISRIGKQRLKQLLQDAATAEIFPDLAPDIVDMDDFWHHSICCGLASTILAREAGMEYPERLFVPGLLHDIGQLILYQANPQLAAKTLTATRRQESYRYLMEKNTIGLTHAQVGQELLRRWNFPPMVQRVVEFHHEPNLAGEFRKEASVVHIATAIANCVEPSWKMDRDRHEAKWQINPYAWSTTGLTTDIIEPTLCEICIESLSVLEVVDPTAATVY